MLESLNRILFHEDDLLKVSTVKSSSWIFQSDVEHFFFKCFSFRYVKQIVGEGFEVLMCCIILLWMYEVKCLCLLGLPLLFSAELNKSAGAEPVESCASADSVPWANSSSQYLQIWHTFNNTQWYLHSSIVKPFIQALRCVSCYTTCYISCLLSLLCYSCSSIAMTPYSPSVWGGVILGFIKLYWPPMASSMCCSSTHSCPHQYLVFWQQRAL